MRVERSAILANQVFVVTGGSKGYGLAIAKVLIDQGAKVALLSRGRQALDAALEQLPEGAVMTRVTDVGDSAQVSEAFNAVYQHFGRIDGLINNAGLAKVGRIDELIDSELQLQVNTNFLGTIYCCRAALPYLKKSDSARIINISSASAFHYDEMAHLSVYAASKAAVERFTRELRRELEDDHVGVTIVRPGTSFSTSFGADLDLGRLKNAVESWNQLGGTMYEGMEPEDVASSVLHCLSCPSGVSIDLLEIRPNKKAEKVQF